MSDTREYRESMLRDALAELVSERAFYMTVIPEIETFRDEWNESPKPKFGYSAPPWQKLYKFLSSHPIMIGVRVRHKIAKGSDQNVLLCCMVVDHYFEEVWGRPGTLGGEISAKRDKQFEENAPWNEICDVEQEVSTHVRKVKALVKETEDLIRTNEARIQGESGGNYQDRNPQDQHPHVLERNRYRHDE